MKENNRSKKMNGQQSSSDMEYENRKRKTKREEEFSKSRSTRSARVGGVGGGFHSYFLLIAKAFLNSRHSREFSLDNKGLL